MANNISVKDSSGDAKVVKTTDSSSVHTPHQNVDTLPGTAAEGAALPSVFLVVAGDDGTDTHPVQVDANGYLKVIAQSNTGVDIGDVDVATLPGTVETDIGTVAGAVSGTEMQVDVVAALPAGTNAIGKLAANSGVDIGDVDVTSIAAGETHVGEVGGNSAILDVTLSLNTSAYIDGDLMADAQEISSALRINDGLGVIHSITVCDKDDQGEALDLYFTNDSTSWGTENSTPTITDAVADGILGKIAIASGDYYDLGGNQIAAKSAADCGIVVKAASGGTSLYVAAISRGTGTYTASGVTLRIGILRD